MKLMQQDLRQILLTNQIGTMVNRIFQKTGLLNLLKKLGVEPSEPPKRPPLHLVKRASAYWQVNGHGPNAATRATRSRPQCRARQRASASASQGLATHSDLQRQRNTPPYSRVVGDLCRDNHNQCRNIHKHLQALVFGHEHRGWLARLGPEP